MSITFRATFTAKHGETVVSEDPRRDAFEHYVMCVQRLGATGAVAQHEESRVMTMPSPVEFAFNPEQYPEWTECPHCHGYGSSLKDSDDRCTQCGGSGIVRKEA